MISHVYKKLHGSSVADTLGWRAKLFDLLSSLLVKSKLQLMGNLARKGFLINSA